MIISRFKQLGGIMLKASKLVSSLSWTPAAVGRNFSSSSPQDWVTTEETDDPAIAILKMNRSPANTLSLEMCTEISKAIKDIESNKKAQAVILTSGLPSIFSAGLDLTELYNPDKDRLPAFWGAFQQLYFDLYGSRLATIGAINGHAPAAGCMLALSCDYRIMSKGNIGLNESKLGICAPPWLGQQFIDTIGSRKAELALTMGTLFDTKDALDIGLIDEIASENEIMEVAKTRAAEWVAIPAPARVACKELTRGRQLNELKENRQHDVDHFCSFVNQEAMQRNLGFYFEHLAKRKK